MDKDESMQETAFAFRLEDRLKRDALASYDPRIFLIRVVSHGIDTHALPDADVDSINEQIAAISHILVRRKVRDFSSQREITNTLANAFCLCSIGLEYASMGDFLKGTQLLLKNKMVKFFQIGNTLVNKLHSKANAVKEKSVLTLPKKDFLSMPDELELCSSLEKQFIAALLDENRMIIDHADMEIETTVPPQPIGALADITIAEKMLDNLAFRIEYMDSLLTDGIDPEVLWNIPSNTGLDLKDNPSREITQALIINLALHQQVGFRVEKEDLANFQNLCCDSATGRVNDATKDFLLKWIGNYFENRMLEFEEDDESIEKYAIEYWKYCIEKLE
ncbi:TPA: hypothetical protein EYP66_06010 [Candidatus Poribacteria bacterium]|nr:hypothetical protein [Candidatus Poribacteria bacterium]